MSSGAAQPGDPGALVAAVSGNEPAACRQTGLKSPARRQGTCTGQVSLGGGRPAGECRWGAACPRLGPGCVRCRGAAYLNQESETRGAGRHPLSPSHLCHARPEPVRLPTWDSSKLHRSSLASARWELEAGPPGVCVQLRRGGLPAPLRSQQDLRRHRLPAPQCLLTLAWAEPGEHRTSTGGTS